MRIFTNHEFRITNNDEARTINSLAAKDWQSDLYRYDDELLEKLLPGGGLAEELEEGRFDDDERDIELLETLLSDDDDGPLEPLLRLDDELDEDEELLGQGGKLIVTCNWHGVPL